MIYKKGDLFSVTSGVIAHGCNCHGVMGSGVAKQVKNLYPEAFKEYHELCSRYAPAKLLGRAQLVKVTDDLYIANLFTQQDFGSFGNTRYVDYNAIDTAFSTLRGLMFDEELAMGKDLELHIPKIGAGLGGGDWDIISRKIDVALKPREATCWTVD